MTKKAEETAVTPSDGAPASQALIVVDDIDTDIIVQELEGRAVTAWAYSFQQDGGVVSGLTVAGVEQCSRESAKHGEALRIVSKEWHWLPDQKAWFAAVEVGRFAVQADGESILLDTALGTKQEASRKYSSRKRRWYEVPNALDIAISKAARNAKRKLLDPELVARVLQAALTRGQVVKPTPERQQAVIRESRREALSPPPSDEKIREDQARATFYATATEMGLTTQTEIHGRLTEVVGLACKGEHNARAPVHAQCHALREAVDRYAETTGPDKAAAWEYLTELIGQAETAEPEEVPFE